MKFLAYLLARFSEPSSYAGLGALLALAGWKLPGGLVAQLVQLLAAVCAVLALVLKERGLIGVVLLVFAVLPALSGCAGVPAAVLGGLGSAGSAYVALDKITAATTPFIATGCAAYAKAKAAADATLAAGVVSSKIAAKVTSVESFGNAACANPPSGDPLSTAIWLGKLTGQIATLVSPAR
jgi:hypothetical protein